VLVAELMSQRAGRHRSQEDLMVANQEFAILLTVNFFCATNPMPMNPGRWRRNRWTREFMLRRTTS
jgi:hypothetical protein